MLKTIPAVLLSGLCFSAFADSEILYDSQGFENLAGSFIAGGYSDVSSQSLATLHPATPQPYELFGGSTLETILFNNTNGYYIDSGAGGSYALGLLGSPVGTPIYNRLGTFITTGYDAFALDINTASCRAVQSVTVEFDLSLAALYQGGSNPHRTYFPNEMWGGMAVAPMVNVKLFDAQNIDANFNTELQSSIETGVRTSASYARPFATEWSHHVVTLPLTNASLLGDDAILTISGAGSDTANENTYVTIDNLVVSLNTPTGVSCSSPVANTSTSAIPSSSTNTLIVLLLSIFAVVGLVLYRQNKVQK